MTVGIVGLGLIGGSMAKSIKARTAHTVFGCDLDQETMMMARMCGAIDAPLTAEKLKECDLVLVAIRPAAAVKWVKEHAEGIRRGAILVDLCGVKRAVVRELAPVAEQYGFAYIGGHPMAAGLSLPEENVDKFREKINACANLTEDDLIPKIKIDIPMPAAYADAGLIREFAVLEPFGKANIKPQFADKNLSITKAFVVGKNQNVLRLNLLTAAGEAVSAVYFGDIEAFKAYYAEKYGSAEVEKAFRGQINKLRIMIVYYPEINEYNGVESVQVIIRNYQ